MRSAAPFGNGSTTSKRLGAWPDARGENARHATAAASRRRALMPRCYQRARAIARNLRDPVSPGGSTTTAVRDHHGAAKTGISHGFLCFGARADLAAVRPAGAADRARPERERRQAPRAVLLAERDSAESVLAERGGHE